MTPSEIHDRGAARSRLFAALLALLALPGCAPRPSPAAQRASGPDAAETSAPRQGGQGAEDEASAAPREGYPGVAVVELFTSEGCSSCPPADRVLAGLAEGAGRSKAPVFVLSFHVDYWNELGWPDPFSSAAFTDRQQRYSAAFRKRGVYTPQMVVNGEAEFVGSEGERARREVTAALGQRAAVQVTLEPVPLGPDAVLARYRVEGAPAGAVLNVALVERRRVSRVTRGENGGRTLEHEGVVRALVSAPLGEGAPGALRVALPRDLDRGVASLVGYAQDGSSLRVLGASRAALPAPPGAQGSE